MAGIRGEPIRGELLTTVIVIIESERSDRVPSLLRRREWKGQWNT